MVEIISAGRLLFFFFRWWMAGKSYWISASLTVDCKWWLISDFYYSERERTELIWAILELIALAALVIGVGKYRFSFICVISYHISRCWSVVLVQSELVIAVSNNSGSGGASIGFGLSQRQSQQSPTLLVLWIRRWKFKFSIRLFFIQCLFIQFQQQSQLPQIAGFC